MADKNNLSDEEIVLLKNLLSKIEPSDLQNSLQEENQTEGSNEDLEDFVDEESFEDELNIESDEENELFDDENEAENRLVKSRQNRKTKLDSKKRVRKNKKTAKERREELRKKKEEQKRRDEEETLEKISYSEVTSKLKELGGDDVNIAPITWELVAPEYKYDVPLLVFSQDDTEILSIALTEKTARDLKDTTNSALYYYMSERKSIQRKKNRKKYEKMSPPKKIAFSLKDTYSTLKYKYGKLAVFGAITISSLFIIVMGVSIWTLITNSDLYYSIMNY